VSISDLIQDGSYSTPISGEGFAVSREHGAGATRVRIDVWGDDIHRSVPMVTEWPVTAGLQESAYESLSRAGLAEQVERLKAAWNG